MVKCTRNQLNFAVLELREKGVLAALEKDWWFNKGECPKARSSKVNYNKSAVNVFFPKLITLILMKRQNFA